MNLINYEEKYDEAIEQLDQLTFFTVKYHFDVIKDTIRLAVEGEELIGIAYLKKKSSFIAIDVKELAYHEIMLEYELNQTHPQATQALEMLLGEMKNCCDEISRQHPGKRIFIKTWLPEEAHEGIEFTMKQGFVIGRCTPVLVRDLSRFAPLADEPVRRLNVQLGDSEAELEIKILEFDDEVMAQYEKSNGSAFYVPDSVANLWFMLNDPNIKVFAAVCGERIIASVTVWKISDDRAATENIFCIDEYRRKGVTSAVIDYACEYLKSQGYSEASLTVFQDNIPAFLLYEKLGYRYEKLFIGLQYEPGYTALEY